MPAALPMPVPRVTNTHTGGFLILALLISLLWFRVNGVALLPVGLVGGLIVAWWSSDIDRQSGKPSQFSLGAILAVVGAFVGFIV